MVLFYIDIYLVSEYISLIKDGYFASKI